MLLDAQPVLWLIFIRRSVAFFCKESMANFAGYATTDLRRGLGWRAERGRCARFSCPIPAYLHGKNVGRRQRRDAPLLNFVIQKTVVEFMSCVAIF